MKYSGNLSGYVVAAFALLSLGGEVQAQSSYPSYVVDAQVPIVSSDGFNDPFGLATAPGGIVYVADSGNHRLLKFAPDGTQTTVSFGAFGPVAQTMSGLARDGVGDLFVADTATNRLIKLPANGGHAVTIMGAPVLDRPTSVAADVAGNLAIVNTGNATVTARRYGGPPFVFNTGSTVLVAPTAVAFDNQGMLYVADAGNGTTPPAVYKFPKLGGTGTSVTPAGYALKNVTGLVLDDQRNLFVLDAGSEQLIEVPASGATPYLIPQSNFKSPSGLALDNLGNIYVSDSGPTSKTVTKFAYRNAANFGSVKIGSASNPMTFNYSFYERTTVEATRGIGGGEWNREYRKAAGGTCKLRTYYPSTSSTGVTLPASCTVRFDFEPTNVAGRPGAVQLQTSNGNETQLTIGVGLGAQIALLNAPITPKFVEPSVAQWDSAVINGAGTKMYYSAYGGPGNSGTFKVPIEGGTPTLLSPLRGAVFVNGAGDVFIASGKTVTKIPADGSASSVIGLPWAVSPSYIAMDVNGAFYLTNEGPYDSGAGAYLSGFVVRVSPAGVVSMVAPGAWIDPTVVFSDSLGMVFVEDAPSQLIKTIETETGSFAIGDSGLTVSGALGLEPSGVGVDQSGSLYFWINADGGSGFGYESANSTIATGNLFTQFYLPVYSGTGITNDTPYPLPFGPFNRGAPTLIAPSGKMYVQPKSGSGMELIDRTVGFIPRYAFNPNVVTFGGNPQFAYVYNIGNENLVFNDPSRAYTESGNGVGSITLGPVVPSYQGPTCQPGLVILPGNGCAIAVNNAAALDKGPTVLDTVHFLTNAINNNSVSFKIYGGAKTAP